jgi:transcriptional regulator with XRE-family HTH domain
MMLQQLIRQALSRRNLSMRQASLAAGMEESWLKKVLNGKTWDPGIGGMVRLADALEIDRLRLLEAVEADFSRDHQSVEAALQVFASMSPKERAAFIAAHRGRRP